MEDSARTAGGKLGEYAYSGRPTEKSAADLLKDIVTNVQEMVRSEVRLAKAELREETQKTMAAAKRLGIASVAAIFAVGFVLWSIAMLLARVLPFWIATLIIGVALGIIADVLFTQARREFHLPMPDKTIGNVKENLEWMKDQTRS